MLGLDRPSTGVRTQLGALGWHHCFCQGRQCSVYPLPVCLLRRPARPPCPARVRILCPLLHTHPAWSGLVLQSPPPPQPPDALPDWPLTEPENPPHFSATLPPTVLGSCLVNLVSIQLQNPSEQTKQNCRRKNVVYTNR